MLIVSTQVRHVLEHQHRAFDVHSRLQDAICELRQQRRLHDSHGRHAMVHGQLVKQNDEALHRMFARMRIRHVDPRESKACIAHDLPCRAQPRVVLYALRRLMDRTMHHDNAAETVAAGQQVLSLQQHRLGQVDTDTDLGWSVL